MNLEITTLDWLVKNKWAAIRLNNRESQPQHLVLIYSLYNARMTVWKENVLKWMDFYNYGDTRLQNQIFCYGLNNVKRYGFQWQRIQLYTTSKNHRVRHFQDSSEFLISELLLWHISSLPPISISDFILRSSTHYQSKCSCNMNFSQPKFLILMFFISFQ